MGKQSSEAEVGVAALERGLAILEAFRRDKAVLSLAELAAITGLYKSTILRLCASLLRLGYLHRLEDGRYRLGPAPFHLGRIYQKAFRLRDAVVPTLQGVVAQTAETASFYIRDGDSDVCLFRAESPRPIRDAGIGEGDRFPVDGSACSRVLSAFSGQPGPDFDAVRAEVLLIARQSRRIAGVSAIVCPVFGMDQKLVGALLLSGPESRFTDQALAQTLPVVVAEAARLTRLLGGDPGVYEAITGRTA